MNERNEQRRGPSLISIVTAVLLAGILIALIVGMLMVRETAQTIQGGSERVRQWQDNLLKQATPTVRPNPATIIHEIQALSRLETVSYTVEKVVTVEKNQQGLADLLALDEKLLFVAHGKVIAGIDLTGLVLQDIVITDENTVILNMPEPIIFITALDNDQSYVYDHERGILNRVFEENSGMETLARKAAQDAIEQAAIEDGILKAARLNGQLYLRSLIMALGYDQVLFVEKPPSTLIPESTPTPI